jgi:hypothetical protein
MKAPTSSSKPKVLVPRGTHLSRCIQVVDLGTQHFKPGDEGSRKLYFGFETSVLRHTFDEQKGPQPHMLQTEFAFYMGSDAKKTKLRTFIEQWFGKAFSNASEAAAFDFSKLLGKAAMLTVAHQPRTDGQLKSVIADIYLPEKGVPIPALVNPAVCYEIDAGEDANFGKLPGFLQKKIRESDEFKRGGQPEPEPEPEEQEEEPAAIDAEPDSDTIPF